MTHNPAATLIIPTRVFLCSCGRGFTVWSGCLTGIFLPKSVIGRRRSRFTPRVKSMYSSCSFPWILKRRLEAKRVSQAYGTATPASRADVEAYNGSTYMSRRVVDNSSYLSVMVLFLYHQVHMRPHEQ